MALDVESLGNSIIAAMKGVFDQKWPEIRDYAVGEGKKMAHALEQITVLRVSGQIGEAECSVLLEMQKNAARAVLLAVEGMALIAVEMAINAALEAVKGVVNTAIGFPFL